MDPMHLHAMKLSRRASSDILKAIEAGAKVTAEVSAQLLEALQNTKLGSRQTLVKQVDSSDSFAGTDNLMDHPMHDHSMQERDAMKLSRRASSDILKAIEAGAEVTAEVSAQLLEALQNTKLGSRQTLVKQVDSSDGLGGADKTGAALDRVAMGDWDVVHRYVKSGMLQKSLARARARRCIAEHRETAAATGVHLSTSQDLVDQLPYWQQADASMLQDSIAIDRFYLRVDHDVSEALQQWWVVAQRSLLHAGAARLDLIDRAAYIGIFATVAAHLTGESGEETLAAVAEDFESDSRGCGGLSRELFLDAVFELADTWTRGVSAGEYTGFLRSLLEQVSRPIGEDGHVFSGMSPPPPSTRAKDSNTANKGVSLRHQLYTVSHSTSHHGEPRQRRAKAQNEQMTLEAASTRVDGPHSVTHLTTKGPVITRWRAGGVVEPAPFCRMDCREEHEAPPVEMTATQRVWLPTGVVAPSPPVLANWQDNSAEVAVHCSGGRWRLGGVPAQPAPPVMDWRDRDVGDSQLEPGAAHCHQSGQQGASVRWKESTVAPTQKPVFMDWAERNLSTRNLRASASMPSLSRPPTKPLEDARWPTASVPDAQHGGRTLASISSRPSRPIPPASPPPKPLSNTAGRPRWTRRPAQLLWQLAGNRLTARRHKLLRKWSQTIDAVTKLEQHLGARRLAAMRSPEPPSALRTTVAPTVVPKRPPIRVQRMVPDHNAALAYVARNRERGGGRGLPSITPSVKPFLHYELELRRSRRMAAQRKGDGCGGDYGMSANQSASVQRGARGGLTMAI